MLPDRRSLISTDRPTLAVVGVGCSGTLVVTHLLRQLTAPLRLVLFEAGDVPGPGVAYGPAAGGHVLNAPARSMSALADDPDDFVRWVEAFDGRPVEPWDAPAESPPRPLSLRPAIGDAFLPRALYGRYLARTLAMALEGAPAGVTVEWRHSRVRSVSSAGDERETGRPGPALTVVDDEGAVTEADAVVLATGPPPPATLARWQLPQPWEQVLVRDPWRVGALDALPSVGDVLLVGTSLTMADVATTLAGRPQHGVVHARSRTGRLPVANSSGACLPLPSRTQPPPATARALLRHLREEAARAEAAGLDWRRAISTFRCGAEGMWAGLDESEQRRAVRHLLGAYKLVRHRLPPSAATTVASLRNEARLSVAAGRLVAIEPAGFDSLGNPLVDVALRSGHRSETLRVAGVVDCTGTAATGRSAANVAPSADAGRRPLVTTLVAEGAAAPHPSGMGLAVDQHGQLRDATGRPHPGLYTIGWGRSGALLEAEGVPEIRRQADQLARRLVECLGRPARAATARSGQGGADRLAAPLAG